VSSATGPTELEEFVEAPGRFIDPGHDMVIRTTPRYTLAALKGGTWAAVEGIRMRDGDTAGAVVEVQAFLAETDTDVASWWLCEHSTPHDLERRLLDAGVVVVEDDYLHAGMLTTTAPPPAPLEARAVATQEEHDSALRVQAAVFGGISSPAFGSTRDVVYGAWIDGEIVAAARATFARVGVLLMGGAVLPEARGRGAYRALVRARWDDAVARGTPALTVGAGPMSEPILRRLGFEQIVQFRRLQSVGSSG
jgi:GNAT superfamily N-acetyltransferase